LYAHGFRFYFTPLTGVLFAFPSRYWFTIGQQEYLALEDGPPIFSQDITCPDLLDFTLLAFSATGLSPAMAAFPEHVRLTPIKLKGWSPFRSPLLSGISVDFFSSRVLRCFSSPRFASLRYVFTQDTHLMHLGFPIRKSRTQGGFCHCSSDAYRRLPRPSSPLTA
jgi:hypothetical protein